MHVFRLISQTLVLLAFCFSLADAQPKKRLAVARFDDGAAYHGSGAGIADMLATALVKSGKFLVVERKDLEKVLNEQKLGASGIITAAPEMLEVCRMIGKVSATGAAILLLGESGTGKELVAQAIHQQSGREQGPFVVVECSGLTETLFESELFGYEKGAFTGANQRKIGLVESASSGTLFLDEVGDIPLSLQVKLLRLLETGTFRRVGGVETLRADFRLIAATHRDLKDMVEQGSFRRDLYYRLSVFPIHLPSLRERREDIALLAETLLTRLAPGRAYTLSEAARARLQAYDFPGNIRELRNIIERAVLMADGDTLLPEHLPPEVANVASEGMPGVEAIVPLETAELRYLQWALAHHGGDRKSLAEQLGISERTLYRKLAG